MSYKLNISNIYNNNKYTINYNKILIKDIFDKIKLFDNFINNDLSQSNILLIDDNNKQLKLNDVIDEKYNNKTILFYYNNFVNTNSNNLNSNYNNNTSINILDNFIAILNNLTANANNNLAINNDNNGNEEDYDDDEKVEDLTSIIEKIKEVVGDHISDDLIKEIYLYESDRNIEITIINILQL